MLGYTDVRRVYTRPLLHLEPDTFHATRPRLYISSAFLDTRPLYFGGPALLRLMLVQRMKLPDNEHPDETSPLLCRWLTGDGNYYHSPADTLSYGYSRQRRHRDFLATCQTEITEAVLRSGTPAAHPTGVTAAVISANSGNITSNTSRANAFGTGSSSGSDGGRWGGGAGGGLVPRFVTIVSAVDQEVLYNQAWVHVAVIPLVAKDAAAVQQQYKWSRTDSGPFLTPDEYEKGDGQVAACMKPLVGSDHLAAALPQWMAFQEALGVAKVIVYMLDPGRIVQQLMQYYEQEGLVELYDFRMSRRLPDPADIANPDRCRSSKVSPRMANQEEGDEWLPCTFKEENYGEIYYWGQMTTIGHCAMNTMARYRWVAILDYDEWLVPRMQAGMKYTEFFKKVQANQATLVANDEGWFKRPGPPSFNEAHSGANWPPAFSFRNTYVCVWCGSQFHNLSITEPWGGAQVKVVVGPDPSVPKLWLAPKSSLHEVFWSAIRDRIMDENDRSKNFIDPLAVVIMDVHDVALTWDTNGGTTVKIPTGRSKKWACLSPAAAVCYHVRISSNNAVISGKVTGLTHRYMAGHGHHVGHELGGLGPSHQQVTEAPQRYYLGDCKDCEHPNPAVVEADYSIVNFYGRAIMDGLAKFKTHYNRRRRRRAE